MQKEAISGMLTCNKKRKNLQAGRDKSRRNRQTAYLHQIAILVHVKMRPQTTSPTNDLDCKELEEIEGIEGVRSAFGVEAVRRSVRRWPIKEDVDQDGRGQGRKQLMAFTYPDRRWGRRPSTSSIF
jgi:hypothetical protein